MRSSINSLKNAKSAQAVFNALFAVHVELAGEKQASHNDGMFTDGCEFKVGGLRFWKDRCISVAECIIAKQSRVSRFIPPSEETLAWGGFLGGETVHYTNEAAKAASVEAVKKIIADAR